MTFREVISTTEFKAIFDILAGTYSNVSSDIDRARAVYKQIYHKLIRKKPVPSDVKIIVSNHLEDSNLIFNVSGIDADKELFGIEFVSWNKWVGMEIESETLEKYERAEIAAHCLWEMTFMGISEMRILLRKMQLMYFAWTPWRRTKRG